MTAVFNHSPGIGAVVIESFEVLSGDEFAAIDSRLNGPESPQDADLLHIAHHRRDLQPLQLGVHRVQPPDQVLQKEVESLGEAYQLAAVYRERCNLGSPQLYHLALVVLRGIFDWRRGRVDGFAGQGAGWDARAAGGDQLRSE